MQLLLFRKEKTNIDVYRFMQTQHHFEPHIEVNVCLTRETWLEINFIIISWRTLDCQLWRKFKVKFNKETFIIKRCNYCIYDIILQKLHNIKICAFISWPHWLDALFCRNFELIFKWNCIFILYLPVTFIHRYCKVIIASSMLHY